MENQIKCARPFCKCPKILPNLRFCPLGLYLPDESDCRECFDMRNNESVIYKDDYIIQVFAPMMIKKPKSFKNYFNLTDEELTEIRNSFEDFLGCSLKEARKIYKKYISDLDKNAKAKNKIETRYLMFLEGEQ